MGTSPENQRTAALGEGERKLINTASHLPVRGLRLVRLQRDSGAVLVTESEGDALILIEL